MLLLFIGENKLKKIEGKSKNGLFEVRTLRGTSVFRKSPSVEVQAETV